MMVSHNGTRWEFNALGTVKPYERPDAYSARRVKDRFISATLAEYCAAAGLAPFDETFYAENAVLVETKLDIPDGARMLSLQEAQRRLGIRPGAADTFDG
ncbi:hypothetical protein AB0J72_18455 [Dactylosporangium sp. NPDC049742]|uniref:hypothetical protein n=1 Tax=Dactylosporangium sp. NPDC049742 TaxID=3154737 RepID=UPI00343A0D1D